jgi:hypothetical protein
MASNMRGAGGFGVAADSEFPIQEHSTAPMLYVFGPWRRGDHQAGGVAVIDPALLQR